VEVTVCADRIGRCRVRKPAGLLGVDGQVRLLRGELEEAKVRVTRGSLVQPAVSDGAIRRARRRPGIDHARIVVAAPRSQLSTCMIDMS